MLHFSKLPWLIITLGIGFATTSLGEICQNKEIRELQTVEFFPSLDPINGDINGDGKQDRLLYNLFDNWITLQFYLNEVEWKKCNPSLELKLVSSETLNEIRGQDLSTNINEKGSIRIASCYYGGSRGFCHDEYDLVLRYLNNNVRIIGYDRFDPGITYPSIGFSMNLLTGRSIITKGPGVLQDDFNEEKKIVTLRFPNYFFEDGEEVAVPPTLEKFIKILHGELDK